MSNACERWGTTRTATSRRARSVFVVVTVAVCALGAALGLGAPGRALASSEAPVADVPARAIDLPCDTAAAMAVSIVDVGSAALAPQPAPPAQDPYADCYKDLAQQLIAPFTEVLPPTCLGRLMELFLGRMTAATAELAAIGASDLTEAEKAQVLASKWKELRAREVFVDALVDVVKSGPACVGQLLPAGPAAVELLRDTVKLREFLGNSASPMAPW